MGRTSGSPVLVSSTRKTHRLPIHPVPAKTEHLAEPHPGVHAEPEHVTQLRRWHRALDAACPGGQHLRGRGDASSLDAVQTTARELPPGHRVGQARMVHRGTPVYRREHLDARVGVHLAVFVRHLLEARRDVFACHVVQAPGVPADARRPHAMAVSRQRARRHMGRLDAQPVVDRLCKCRQGTRAGARLRRVAPVAHRTDERLCALARIGRRQPREASQSGLAIRVGAPPRARAALHEEALRPARGDAQSQAGHLVVPDDVGALEGQRARDRLVGQGALARRHPPGARIQAAASCVNAPSVTQCR